MDPDSERAYADRPGANPAPRSLHEAALAPPRKDPQNPWNPDGIGTAGIVQRLARDKQPYDAEAKGLDGDSLDALLKARMSEGIEIGFKRGREAAESSFEQIHDGGYDRGYTHARQEAATVLNGLKALSGRELGDLITFLEDERSKLPERQVKRRDEFRRRILAAERMHEAIIEAPTP